MEAGMKGRLRQPCIMLVLTLLALLPAVRVFPSVITPGGAYLEGLASWYAEFSLGIRKTTANMEIFDHHKLTCAMWGQPFGTLIEVTNPSNGKKVIVRINDRGPAKRLCQKGRIIDLSMAAFKSIANLDKGLTKVHLRIIK